MCFHRHTDDTQTDKLTDRQTHTHTHTHSHTHPAIQQLVFGANLLPLSIASFSQQIDDGHLIRA